MSEAREIKIGHERTFLLLSDVSDGSSTRSSSGDLDSIQVRLVLPRLRAETRVWLDEIVPPLPSFFDELSREWRDWRTERTWQTYEGGLILRCTHDGLGHVSIDVELYEGSGGWGRCARGVVPLDVGQLEPVAHELSAFFGR